MILRHRAIAGVAALLLASLIAAAAVAANRASDFYTVPDVPVDATAASAAAARDAARLEGQRRAFGMLLDRITQPQDHDRLPKVTDQMLTDDLVQDFEVLKERASAVHYLGTYTFRFRAEAVRRLLRQAGIAFAAPPTKSMVVLPVFHDGDRLVLWDDPNPWRDAWANRTASGGLVPLTLPLGELADVQAIDGAAAVHGDAAAIAAISQRYGNGDVLVTEATLSGSPKTLSTSTTHYSATGAGDQPISQSYKANPGESDHDLMARAIADMQAHLDDAWKRPNIVHFDQSGMLTATVPLSDLRDWVAVRDTLAGTGAVQRTDLISLDRRAAHIVIHYYGDPEQLGAALAQHDLVLTPASQGSVNPAPGAPGNQLQGNLGPGTVSINNASASAAPGAADWMLTRRAPQGPSARAAPLP